MKHQALFPSKDKSKKIKCRLLQFLFGALRVKKKRICSLRRNSFSSKPLYVALFVVRVHIEGKKQNSLIFP